MFTVTPDHTQWHWHRI